MTRLVLPPLPLSPESDYDRRLQQYLQQALGITVSRAVDDLAALTSAVAVAFGPSGDPESMTVTAPLFVPFGTAGAPGLAFTGTQTGVFGSASQWSVSVGGAEQLRVDDLGCLRLGVPTGLGDSLRRWTTIRGLAQSGVQLQTGAPAVDRGYLYGNSSGLFVLANGRLFLSGGNDTSRGVSVAENGAFALTPLAADPAGTSHGQIWALANGTFRRNRNGTVETW